MQNPVPEFWQGSIISEKPGYLPEKWKLWWRAPTTIKFNIFGWTFAYVSYLKMPKNGY